jgi:hypothetical protein
MNSYRPFGPQLCLLDDSYPDLTVGAITSWPFGPNQSEPSLTVGLLPRRMLATSPSASRLDF